MYVRRRLGALTIAAALALTGCAQEPSPAPSPSPSPTSTESASPSPEPTGEPAIVIDQPVPGSTITVPFEMSGTSDTFEGTVIIDAVDESGRALCERVLTATGGMGVRGDWVGTLAFPPVAAAQRVTVRAYTVSAADGSMIDLVEVPAEVSPELPGIVLTSPRCGDVYQVGGSISITGTAAVPGASFVVELRDAEETVAASLVVTADDCCTHSPFLSSLALDVSPGWYDVVAYDEGTADGSTPIEFRVQVEVRS